MQVFREDEGKVPDDFPQLKCISRLMDGKCHQPYYKAKEVWKWFKLQSLATTVRNKDE